MKNPKMFIKTALSIILCLIFKSHLVSSQTTLIAPINKDNATSLYTLNLSGNNPYVIDIGAIFSWQSCLVPPPLVARFTSPCIQAQYLSVPYCSVVIPDPGITNVCFVTPANSVDKVCTLDVLVSTNLTVPWPDGPHQINTTLSCALISSINGHFPYNIQYGLVSLSRGPLAFQAQISNSFPKVTRKFAMCLPTMGSGLIFFGDGPYNLAQRTNFAPGILVSYVPLLISPRSVDYFIGLKALSVSGHSIPLSPNEGIPLTTVAPYTTIRSDVYNQFLKFFTEEMKGIPQVEKVEPFNTCYNATAIGHDDVGLQVPKIDFEFDNGSNWTIYGPSSMKLVGEDVACLAILDGGENQQFKVVVGSYQMEEYLLVFDNKKSRFGFSSYLPLEGISCGYPEFLKEVEDV